MGVKFINMVHYIKGNNMSMNMMYKHKCIMFVVCFSCDETIFLSLLFHCCLLNVCLYICATCMYVCKCSNVCRCVCFHVSIHVYV